MKYQILFSWKIKKNISKCHLLKLLLREPSVKQIMTRSYFMSLSTLFRSYQDDGRVIMDISMQ